MPKANCEAFGTSSSVPSLTNCLDTIFSYVTKVTDQKENSADLCIMFNPNHCNNKFRINICLDYLD